MSALFRWVVYDIALLITQAVISLMDQKSWPAPAADRPNPLIYMNEKDWKKDGLNPVFPLAGLMLLIRSHLVRPAERPPGAPTMCTPRGCVDVCARARGCACARTCARAPVRACACVCVCACVRLCVRVVVSCSRECTRGGLEGRLSVIV